MLQTLQLVSSTSPISVLDEEGFLLDADDWTRTFSKQQALQIGVRLDDRHWALIELIRDKYLRLGSLPLMRTVCKTAGFDKSELKQQFGSCLTLWRIAGLPNPGEEAKTYMN